MALVEIRQIANEYGKALKTHLPHNGNEHGFTEFTVFPYSLRHYSVGMKSNGEYNTGLDELGDEMIRRMEGLLQEDLSPRNEDFWGTRFSIKLETKGRSNIMLNTSRPMDLLTLKAGIANNVIAPSEEEIKENPIYKKLGTVFYVHDTNEILDKKVKLQELKDLASATLYKYKNDRDRLVYILFKLGKKSNKSLRNDVLYTMLSEEKEKKKTREDIEKFIGILESPVEELQANYFVEKGLILNLLSLDTDSGRITFDGRVLGHGKEAAKKFLSSPENKDTLFFVREEIFKKEPI